VVVLRQRRRRVSLVWELLRSGERLLVGELGEDQRIRRNGLIGKIDVLRRQFFDVLDAHGSWTVQSGH
jgi:hypothetical protein